MRIHQYPVVQRLLGGLLAGYLRFVFWSCRKTTVPADADALARQNWPVIVTMWHGQHFMVPFARPHWARVAVMIALHGDAEINAIAAARLGMDVVRGSGAKDMRDIGRKKGAAAFMQLIRLMRSNISVALTADVPKGPDKIAGKGVVLLARLSGRPLLPVAVATQHRFTVRSWDKAAIPLPFGRMVIVLGEPLMVPADASDADTETWCLAAKQGLDRAHCIAYELADRRAGTFVTRTAPFPAES